MGNENNSSIIEKLFREKRKYFFVIARNLTNNIELSEDIVQDAFYLLLKWKGVIQSYRHASLLLSKITKDSVYNYQKHNTYANKRKILFSAMIQYIQDPSYVRTDLYPLVDNIKRKISQLTSKQARVVKMYLDGMEYAEIGRDLKLSNKTIHTHAKAAFKKLKLDRPAEEMKQKLSDAGKNLGGKSKTFILSEKVINSINEGESDLSISERVGINEKNVSAIWKRYLKRTKSPLFKSGAQSYSEKVTKVVGLFSMGMSMRNISKALECTEASVSIILKQFSEGKPPIITLPDTKSDAWYKEIYDKFHTRRTNGHVTKFTEDQVRRAKELHLQKEKPRKISEMTGIDIVNLKGMLYGKSWTHVIVVA